MVLWLGRLGLLFDLIGACFLWRGGTPLVYRPRYAVITPTGYDPKTEEQVWHAKAAALERRNKIGVALLVAGFALQLIGTWASR